MPDPHVSSAAAAPDRCQCARCGAHTLVSPAFAAALRCGTCGSCDLEPIAPPGAGPSRPSSRAA